MRERGSPALEFENARPEDAFTAALEGAAQAAGLRVGAGPDEPVAVLALPDGWPAYLRGLGRHASHGARALETDLDCLFAFFRRASGAKGRFAAPAIEQFVRRISRLALADGSLRLDLLEDAGAPLGARPSTLQRLRLARHSSGRCSRLPRSSALRALRMCTRIAAAAHSPSRSDMEARISR
jgi:hypothetical protein